MGTVYSCPATFSPGPLARTGVMTPDRVAAFCDAAARRARRHGFADTPEDWRLLVNAQQLLDARGGWLR